MVKASETSIFKEYCHYLHKYKEKYGDKTITLMQVGSFYEIYAILNEEEQLGEVDIYHICQNVMNISVAKKTNKVLMGGFQMPYSEKFIRVLIENGYTVVLVEQLSEGSGADRDVKEILSPGTYMEYNDSTTSHIMSVFIEKVSHSFIGVGISIIDVTTGTNYIYQIGNTLDPNFWKDELSRLINYYSPKEFLFQTYNYDITENDIINFWDIQTATLQINHYKDSSYRSIDYQNEFLLKIFKFESLLSPIENLDLVHTHEMRNSYVYLLLYIYEHKQGILQNIHSPQKINDINHLSLTSNSVRQLNVVQNYSYYKGKNESLYSICDDCGFIGGKRLLKQRLLYPSTDPNVINKRYSRVEAFLKDNLYLEIRPELTKLTDTERCLRKMGLGTITPDNFLSAKLSYDFIIRILDKLEGNTELMELYNEYTDNLIKFRSFYKRIYELFNFRHLVKNEQSYFKKGIHSDLDEVSESVEECRDNLECIAKRLSSIIDDKKPNACKFDNNDKHGFFLYCTKNRSKTLLSRFKNIPNHCIKIRDNDNKVIYKISSDSFSFSTKDSSNVFIETPEINDLTKTLSTCSNSIKALNDKYWSSAIEELYTEYNDILLSVHNFVSDLDVVCATAKVSIEYKYTKPILIENEKSCLIAKDIRHPIVERISTDTEYVTNDVTLGTDNEDGMLLFGTNACGKSTLMKAIGLNVILAQAGMFVPCSEFKLKPYTQIFTRILNNDNIFRSQSSFAVEVMELRSIFQLADDNSLILGDELCSGTETLSAISIVSKSLDILSKKKSSFMITSHLHQLNDIPLVQELSNLNIYHLKIRSDGGELVYDRKLSRGSGPPIYGLTVCEAMGLSDDFVKGSNQILNQLIKKDQSITTKKSQYSSKVFMDECKVCGGSPDETHHIKEQQTADENNMIDHHHKNNKHNLVPLCKSCHLKVTHGGLEIYGWKQTSRGKQLDFEFKNSEKKQTKKFNQSQIEIIQSFKEDIELGQLSKKTCLDMVDSEYGFRPSMKVFNEIIKGTY